MSEMFDFKNYQWRKMAKNGEKWRKMAMANLPFSFVKFAISPLAPPPPPGVPKVIVQRFGLNIMLGPELSDQQNFFGKWECFRKVAHSRNTLRLVEWEFIFSNERSFFTMIFDFAKRGVFLE